MESGCTGTAQLVYANPQCDVWMCDLAQPPSAAELATLSRDEITRADRFLHSAHKANFLAAHVVLRRLISSHAGLPAEQLVFQEQQFGKPCVSGPATCFFNLSHSADLALIALSSQFEVGVDIELIREIDDVQDIAREHFTPAELDAWSRLPPSEQAAAFHQIWVRKEACVKSVGLGLHVPLKTVEVGMGPFQQVVQISALDENSSTLSEVKVRSIKTRVGSCGAVAWTPR